MQKATDIRVDSGISRLSTSITERRNTELKPSTAPLVCYWSSAVALARPKTIHNLWKKSYKTVEIGLTLTGVDLSKILGGKTKILVEQKVVKSDKCMAVS